MDKERKSQIIELKQIEQTIMAWEPEHQLLYA